jgi:hypothetical protein
VRVPHRFASLIALIAGSLTAIGVMATRASAQVVEITPLPTESPSSKLAPGTQWVNWMAIGAGVIVVLAVLAIAAGYLRFAPKFFGREESVRPLAPGTRPASLTRQAAQVRYTPPPPGEHRPATAETPAPAQARTATAVAERPAATEAPARAAASTPAASTETATERTTAPPAGEPAAQADAVGQAEAEAPEARPTAKTEEEVAAAPAEPQPPAAPAEPQTAAPSQPAAPAQPAATHGGGGEMDQETFDRVLEEQLGRGVDRRVAEGRARAAAVVAARKKAQG